LHSPSKARCIHLQQHLRPFPGLRQRKALGVGPYWCVNHGPTISLYYPDPDGNNLDTQVNCFDTPEEATECTMSPEFAENPLDVDYDPEEMTTRVERPPQATKYWTRDPSTLPGI
jgi:hypothetical protein